MDVDRCVCCGNYVPEGSMICWACQQQIKEAKETKET